MTYEPSQELADLLSALIDDAITPKESRRLAEMLSVDSAARAFYRGFIGTHAMMLWWRRNSHVVEPDGSTTIAVMPVATLDRSSSLPFLSTTLHNTLGYLPEGVPLAYLIATVVTGLGILIASHVYMSRPEQVARQSVPATVVVEPAPVGRITGMIDCKWEKKGLGIGDWGLEKSSRAETPKSPTFQSLIPNPKSLVSLGDQFTLASGLMEITYDAGAKVILQGPVTYEVEPNGGYLSLGKLTGKLGARGERREERGEGDKSETRNQKSEISGPSPLSPLLSPLFVIRTPTATVTDLGTEFGVEVSDDGATKTHVFVGEVRIATGNGQDNSSGRTRVISAGQSARVGHNEAIAVGTEDQATSAKRFARTMPGRRASAGAYAELVLSMNPVVYYRMEEWPRGNDKDTYVLVDSSPGRHHGTLHYAEEFGGEPWFAGRFGRSLWLRGSGAGDCAVVEDYPRADKDQLSVSAWVWNVGAVEPFAAAVSNWLVRPGPKQFGQFFLGVISYDHPVAIVTQRNGDQVFVFARDGKELPRHAWQHMAIVADGEWLRLYLNGVEVGASPCRGIACQAVPKDLRIGCLTSEINAGPQEPWVGRLDEIAIFNHALRAEQVRQLYTGAPAGAVPPAAKTRTGQTRSRIPAEEKGGVDKQ